MSASCARGTDEVTPAVWVESREAIEKQDDAGDAGAVPRAQDQDSDQDLDCLEAGDPLVPPEALPPAVSASRLDTLKQTLSTLQGKDLQPKSESENPPNRWYQPVQLELSRRRQLAWHFATGDAKWEPLASELTMHQDAGMWTAEDQAQGRLFDTDGAQMTFAGWRETVGRNLDAIGKQLGGKFGRGLRRQAKDLQLCGEFAQRSTCHGCGTERTILAATCNSRVCPSCERVRAAGKVGALTEKLEELRKRRPYIRRLDGSYESFRPRLVTLTVRFDVADPSEFYGDRMRERRADLLRLFDLSWKEISRGPHGERLREAAAHWAIEVGYGGLVHLHALVWSPFIDVAGIRASFAAEGFEGRANIDVQLIRSAKGRGRGGIREAVKYIAKGSGPSRSVGEFFDKKTSTRMDPGLAAIIVASWKGLHLSGTRGAIRGLEERAEELEPTIADGGSCSCGSLWASQVWLHRTMLDSIDGVGRFGIKGKASAVEKLANRDDAKPEKTPSARDVAAAIHESRGPPPGRGTA